MVCGVDDDVGCVVVPLVCVCVCVCTCVFVGLPLGCVLLGVRVCIYDPVCLSSCHVCLHTIFAFPCRLCLCKCTHLCVCVCMFLGV